MTQETLDNAQDSALNDSKDSLNYEELASKIGWVPKEKFRGDPEKHVDAKTFYEKGEFVLPIVRQQREEARKEVEKLKRQIEDLKSVQQDFQKFTEADAERKYKEKLAELKDIRAKAVAAGDDATFRQADDAIDEIKEKASTAKVPEKKETASADPEFEAWLTANDWYAKDAKKRRLADSIGMDLMEEKPDMTRAEMLEAVVARLEEIEAEKGGTNRPGPQRAGKTTKVDAKAHTFDNLLPDYKKAYDRFIKNGIKMTKEQYVSKCDPDAWGA